MSRRASPVYVGIFVVGMIALAIGLVLFIGKASWSGGNKLKFELVYDSSIMGLNVGAPVTLKGVKIGEVSDIRTKLYTEHEDFLNTVYVDIYPDSVVQVGEVPGEQLVPQMVRKGLAAKLKTQSLLTGLLYVEVDFYKNEARVMPVATEFPQIPTVPTDFESITEDVEAMNLPEMVNDLRSLTRNLNEVTSSDAFKSMPENLNTAFASFEAMSVDMAKSMSDMRDEFVPMAMEMETMSKTVGAALPDTLKQVNQALVSVERTLQSIERTSTQLGDTVAPDSPLMYQIERSARDLSHSANALKSLAEMLEEQPGSVLSGRESE